MERGVARSGFFSHRKSDSCDVLSGYFGIEILIFKKQQTYEEGHILIINVSISDSEYILINLYNANIKIEQVDVLSNLFELLKEFDTNKKKYIIMAGDFNLVSNLKLHIEGGNPTL